MIDQVLPPAQAPVVSAAIFKAYDIRGIVETALTEEAVSAIGLALGAKARARGIGQVVVGRDGRLSGPALARALSAGLCAAGVDVIDIGMVPTPLVYFATVLTGCGTGVAVTGSHNPPDYNGFKMMLGGDTLAGEAIQELLAIIEKDGFVAADKQGSVTEKDISGEYHNNIVGHIKLKRPMKIAIDAGNGVGGAFAGKLYKGLGNEVTELFCEVDGNFPNHHPDPSKPKNLQDLIVELKNSDAEIGLAFDGDADRLGVVTKDGNIIYPDRQLMLFAQDVLSRNPKAKVIFDVKSTRLLAPWIKEHGGEPVMEKTGHSFIKSTMKKTGALVAGEMSGHVFFKERWFGFDDGMYAGARLLEILSAFDNPSEVLNKLPQSISTPELNIDLPEGSNGHKVIEELAANAKFEGATEIITIDGLRVEFPDGFGLMRASNTTPILVLRFEADTQEAIERIQNQFKAVIESNPALKWPL